MRLRCIPPLVLAWFASAGVAAEREIDELDQASETSAAGFPAQAIGLCHGQLPVKRTTCDTLKNQTYQRVMDKVAQLFETLPDECTVTDCARADFVGCVLRFAGHDLMDFDPETKTGGSDGCLAFSDPDNAGLMPCLAGDGEFGLGVTLQNAYADFCNEVSFADFVVIAAEALMVRSRGDWDPALKRSGFELQEGFRFGRLTSPTCMPGPLPNPEDSCKAVKSNFIDALGLSWKEATALMGAHTVGKASRNNSGYDGFWNTGLAARSFNNSYYISMMAAGWGAQSLPGGKGQWVRVDGGPQNEMMLNTDMCLLFDTPNSCSADHDKGCCLWLDDKGLGGVPSMCAPGAVDQDNCCLQPHNHENVKMTNTCTDHTSPIGALPAGTESAAAVRLFAESEPAWLDTFRIAWRKATENGMRSILFDPKLCNMDPADLGGGLAGRARIASKQN